MRCKGKGTVNLITAANVKYNKSSAEKFLKRCTKVIVIVIAPNYM